MKAIKFSLSKGIQDFQHLALPTFMAFIPPTPALFILVWIGNKTFNPNIVLPAWGVLLFMIAFVASYSVLILLWVKLLEKKSEKHPWIKDFLFH